MSQTGFISLSELESSFRRLSSEYHARKEEAEAQAVAWEWASNCRYDPRPFHYERHRVPRGRRLRTPGLYQYGLDARGSVVVEQQATEFPGQIYETFYRWGGEVCEIARYDYFSEKEPIAYSRLQYANGRLSTFESRGRYGVLREHYVWNGSRLDRIEVLHSPVIQAEPLKEPEPGQVVEVSYDELGVLSEIRIRHHPRPPQIRSETVEIAYQRPPGSLKYKDLLKLVTSKLTEHIPAVLRNYKVEEPVCCLALWWSPGQFSSLPPAIGIGLESERIAWADTSIDEPRSRIWNPAHYRHFAVPALELENPELLRACELLNQETNKRADDRSVQRVLLDVASTLNWYPWAEVFSVADDFVVFVVAEEEELPEIRRGIKATASESVYAQLRARNWL